jgi:LemA protein
VRSFPVNLTAKMFGYKEKPNFQVANEAEISKPPSVEFAPAAAPAGTATPTSSTPAPAH